MPEYLTVADFLAYDSQITRKIGRINDNVDALREQVNNLTTAFTSYVAETDAYRIQTNRRLDSLSREMADIKQMMSQGFALIFARLGITQP